MRRLTTDDTRLLALAAAAGGSVCPGTDATISREAHKLLRRLALRGDLTTEDTDDGPRFTLTAQGHDNAQT